MEDSMKENSFPIYNSDRLLSPTLWLKLPYFVEPYKASFRFDLGRFCQLAPAFDFRVDQLGQTCCITRIEVKTSGI